MMFRMPALCLSLLILAGIASSPLIAAEESVTTERNDITPREAIGQALAEKIDWKFTETPLSDFAAFLQDALKIPVQLDPRGLAEEGLAPETPLTFKASDISAKSALHLMFFPMHLSTTIHDDVLLITSEREADGNVRIVVYDVADLLPSASATNSSKAGLAADNATVPVHAEKFPTESDAVFDPLIDAITRTIEPASWDAVGGQGSIQPLDVAGIGVIVVSQTDKVHEKIADFLRQLRALRHGSDAPPKDGSPTVSGGPSNIPLAENPDGEEAAKSAEQAKFRAALAKKVSFNFKEVPLDEVVDSLRQNAGVNLLLDDDSCEPKKIKITVQLKNVELKTALELMLQNVELAWTVAHDSIWITTKEQAEGTLETRTYDISDLASFRNEKGDTLPDYEQLVDAITRTIEPSSWDEAGGPASIQPFTGNGVQALVVEQTWAAQERICQLLADVRKIRGRPMSKQELDKLPLLPSTEE